MLLPHRRHRVSAIASLAAAALLATACGSTVQTTSSGQVGSGSVGATDGLGTSLDQGAVGAAGADLGAAGSADQAGPGAVPGSPSGSGQASTTRQGAAGSAPGAGPEAAGTSPFGAAGTAAGGGLAPGITDDTITIGAEYFSGADQTIADAGIKSVTVGDGRKQTQVIVDHINEQGGVAGRKLNVVFHDYNNSNTDSGAQSDLAACSKFTEDNKVFAVISTFNSHSDSFRACLNKASTLLLSDTSPSFDNRTLELFPTFLPILALSLDRRINAVIDGLARQQYFTPWDFRQAAPAVAGAARIGLVSLDLPVYTAHIPQVEAELAKRGQKLEREVRVATEADIASAVLRFSTEGISHVIFNQEGAVFGLFAAAAVNQEYYPRYGVDTKDFPQIVLENVPQHKAFNGLRGIGWSPTTDVKERPAFGPEQQACLKIFSDQGIETSSNNQQSLLVMLCDYFFFFDRVGSAAGPGLSTASFLNAASQVSN